MKSPQRERTAIQRSEARIFIGTSGWSYGSWKDGYYAGVPRRNWLAHCARRFTGIEIDSTFYRAPQPATLTRWRDETPAGFRFAVKGHRIVTHSRKLRDAGVSVDMNRVALAPLGDRLAAVLWQLPASVTRNIDRLRAFLVELDRWPSVRHVMEFRHTSWFDTEVADCLAAQRVAHAISDAPDWPMWDAVTTDLAYVRLHGHTRTYASRYAGRSIRRWAERVRAWHDEGREVHIYFDNDAEGAAPYDAERLLGELGLLPDDD